MKKQTGFLFLMLCMLLAGISLAQDEPFQHCTAAFLNKRMVVNEYSTTGKCVLAPSAQGELTVQTVELSSTSAKALRPIPFIVAIRDGQTRTMTLFAQDEVLQMDVRKVLAKCKQGDSIVLLTVDNRYALPHNEILIQ